MLVLRGEWLKAIGFPIGATAFLSTDKRGDITSVTAGVRLVPVRELRDLDNLARKVIVDFFVPRHGLRLRDWL